MRRDSKSARCDIAVLVDEEVGERNAAGRFVVERRSMEEHVLRALGQRHSICVVPFDPALTPTIDELRTLKPRLVFNLTEWVGGKRRLDAAIAGMLEMMKLRYTGAGPEAMQLARDKALAKAIVAALGVEVAPHTIVNGRRPARASMRFPLIVKPQCGDGSDEIGSGALVRTAIQLGRRLDAIRKRTREPLICEDFVPGRDLFVALLGNEPRVMPAVELVVGRRGRAAPTFSSSRVKNDERYQKKWRLDYRVARLPRKVAAHVNDASRRIFHALRLRDYARIDYRLTPDHRLVFLEANPNPDLMPDSFGREGCFAGVEYPDLIAAIVRSAMSRPK